MANAIVLSFAISHIAIIVLHIHYITISGLRIEQYHGTVEPFLILG